MCMCLYVYIYVCVCVCLWSKELKEGGGGVFKTIVMTAYLRSIIGPREAFICPPFPQKLNKIKNPRLTARRLLL